MSDSSINSDTLNNELKHINEKLDHIFKKLERGQYETRIAVLEAESANIKRLLWGTIGLASTALLTVFGAITTYFLTH